MGANLVFRWGIEIYAKFTYKPLTCEEEGGTINNKFDEFHIQVIGDRGKPIERWGRKAKKPLRKGGPYCLAAKVFHRDGTKKTYRVCFAKKTHGWQRRSKTFTTVKRYNKIVVYLRYAKQGGTAWFDDVSLIEN